MRKAMVDQNLQTITFSKNAFDLGNSHLMINNDIPRAVFALNGDIGDMWKWDAGYEYGIDRYNQTIENATAGPNLTFATDAVMGPNGQPVCRATLPGASFNAAAAGCVPINLFGDGVGSADAIAYVQQTARSDSRYVQQDAVANIKGTPFSTWAGPVAVAFGAEYRKESQVVTSSPLSASNAFLFAGNSTPFRGDFDVTEAYVDTLVPLISDKHVREGADVQRRVPIRGLQQHRQPERLEGRSGLRACGWLPRARHPFDRHSRPRNL